MRIRYYDFLANAVREKKLKVIRKALSVADENIKTELETLIVGIKVCPQCEKSDWHFVGVTVRLHWQPE